MNPRFGTYMFLDMSRDAVIILGLCQSPFYGDAHCVRSLSIPKGVCGILKIRRMVPVF
jgi:hypothetical protein